MYYIRTYNSSYNQTYSLLQLIINPYLNWLYHNQSLRHCCYSVIVAVIYITLYRNSGYASSVSRIGTVSKSLNNSIASSACMRACVGACVCVIHTIQNINHDLGGGGDPDIFVKTNLGDQGKHGFRTSRSHFWFSVSHKFSIRWIRYIRLRTLRHYSFTENHRYWCNQIQLLGDYQQQQAGLWWLLVCQEVWREEYPTEVFRQDSI